jgi:hypothetical protein
MEKFNAFIPMQIEKSKNEITGAPEYKFKCVATDDSIDSDNEIIEPNGIDFSDLLSYGNVNYNHLAKSSPKSIIGHATKAKVVDNKLLVEGILYGDSQLANDVVEVAQMLERHGNKRKFGISIEGIPLEKSPINNKRITKSRVHSIAVCPMPKNKNTVFQILKGQYDNLYENYEYEEIEKSEDNSNGLINPEFLVDINDIEKGIHVTMDRDLNIKIEKGGIGSGRHKYKIGHKVKASVIVRPMNPLAKKEVREIKIDGLDTDENGEPVYSGIDEKGKRKHFHEKDIVEKSEITSSTSGKEIQKEHLDKDLKNLSFAKAIVTVADGYKQGLVSEEEKNKVVEKLINK